MHRMPQFACLFPQKSRCLWPFWREVNCQDKASCACSQSCMIFRIAQVACRFTAHYNSTGAMYMNVYTYMYIYMNIYIYIYIYAYIYICICMHIYCFGAQYDCTLCSSCVRLHCHVHLYKYMCISMREF